MTLTNTGPLVALFNRNDAYHVAASETAAKLPPQALLSTWPCFTEAMYLLGRAVGPDAQQALWNWLLTGRLILRDATPAEVPRMAELMKQYRDLPMDLADASIVTTAEVTGQRRVFAFDQHYRIYRLKDGSFLDVVP